MITPGLALSPTIETNFPPAAYESLVGEAFSIAAQFGIVETPRLRKLFGIPGITELSPQTLAAGRFGYRSREIADRMEMVVEIYEKMDWIEPVPDRVAHAWLLTPCEQLRNRTPISLMLSGRMSDLQLVVLHLYKHYK